MECSHRSNMGIFFIHSFSKDSESRSTMISNKFMPSFYTYFFILISSYTDVATDDCTEGYFRLIGLIWIRSISANMNNNFRTVLADDWFVNTKMLPVCSMLMSWGRWWKVVLIHHDAMAPPKVKETVKSRFACSSKCSSPVLIRK